MEPRIKELVYWINERESMRINRTSTIPIVPYSHDPIMANTRFTNVMREDDKVTKWLKEHWRDPHARSPNLPTAMVLARMVNYIPSLEAIGFPEVWKPEIIISILKNRAFTGYKIWSSAYMITTCGKQMEKEHYVVNHVCGKVMKINSKVREATSLEEAFRILRTIDGLGSFLAAQVIADLKHVRNLPLAEAPDWHSWSAPGPGSLKGLTAFFGYAVTPSNYDSAIIKAWQLIQPELPEYLQDLSMQDFQNCFCEFSKFLRVKSGGKARNHYP